MLAERSILIPVVAGIFALASWLLLQLSMPEQRIAEVIASHGPDYYSAGYQKKEMNTLGLLTSEIKAAKMQHYPDDGSVHLEAPVLKFYRANLPPWVITASNGVLSQTGKELWLHGAVLVTRAAAKGGRSITIKTSEVRVLPESSDAHTTQWAELSSPPDITSGVGMQLHFTDPIHIKLLNNVRGKYENH